MLRRLKVALRDMLPPRLQVPIKYWFVVARGEAEPEMALLPALVRRGERAVDIGGNRGLYAYRLHKLGAQVDVFEPNPACYEVLAHWAARNPSVRIHPVALSSRVGEAALHIPVGADGVEHDSSASIEASTNATMHSRIVPLRLLDSYGFTDAALIKIDVEGHEYDVIEGATATLRASCPALLVEIEQRHLHRPITEVFEKFLAFGYRGFFLDGSKLVPITQFDVKTHQSLDTFGTRGHRYHNNFLFLDRARLERGDYRELARQWLD